MPPEATTPAPPQPLDRAEGATAILLGFGALALFEAVLGPIHFWPGSAGALAQRTLWGIGSLLLCGTAFTALVVAAWSVADAVLARVPGAGSRTRQRARWVVLALVSTGVACTFLPDALDLAAHTLFGGRHGLLMQIVFMAAAGVGIAGLAIVGRAARRRRWLWVLPVGAALAGMYENHVILSDDYPELHCALGWSVAVLFGFGAAPLGQALAARVRLRRGLALVAAAWSTFALLVPAPNPVRLTLFRSAASGAWPLAMAVWRLPELAAPQVPADMAAWFQRRDALPPVPPTARPPRDGAPVVVLVTVDGLRGDLLRDRSHDDLWPALAKLRDESVYFAHARSPGSQTAVSMATLFSGKYFSQLYWTKYGVARARLDYPVLDPSPRVPALLSAAGVHTFKVASVRALANEYGLAPGFTEELVIPPGRGAALAKQVVPPLVAHLDALGDRPELIFTHLMEAHGPYSAGVPYFRDAMVKYPPRAKSPSPLYVGGVVAADKAIAKIVEALDRPALAGRVTLIVSADHGEAFGEHGYLEHAKSLHEELLDIPLMIRGPGLTPREVDEPVGLVDLGPTLLDWFGEPTPASFMGESLVPVLLGRTKVFTRPLLAEGRLRRTLLLGDVKLIVDERRKVMEAYDLKRDPKELRNLWDEDRGRLGDVSGALRAFFDVQQYRENGYEPVFRR